MKNLIQNIEKVVSDFHAGRRSEPVTFTGEAVEGLASQGEFYPIGGGKRNTVGSRKPPGIGMTYSHKNGLVIAASQCEADSIAKEIPVEKILIYAGILITVAFS